MKKRAIFLFLLIVILIIFIFLFLTRLFSSKQLDDVSPEIPCNKKLMEKADILYVIPKFNNKSISENQDWCNEILVMNKTIRMHGIYHTYHEFLESRNSEYIEKGIMAFENCFGFKPESFKPPQMVISKENALVIEKTKMKLDSKFSQVIHKVYHCNNTGKLPNWFMDVF